MSRVASCLSVCISRNSTIHEFCSRIDGIGLNTAHHLMYSEIALPAFLGYDRGGPQMTSVPPLLEETYQRWKKLALDLCRSGGWPRDLIPLLGLSDGQWRRFMDIVHERAKPRKRVEGHPILIPPTSPTLYISFRHALNLRLRGEHTGARHFRDYLFGFVEPTVIPLAGIGGVVDSTPSLGSYGVRDMGRIIADRKVQPCNGPVHVAKHFCALADIALSSLMHRPLEELRGLQPKSILSAWEVSDMLNHEEADIDRLIEEYLTPLRCQLEGVRKETFDRWLPTIVVQD